MLEQVSEPRQIRTPLGLATPLVRFDFPCGSLRSVTCVHDEDRGT